jgi:hypothetical protein
MGDHLAADYVCTCFRSANAVVIKLWGAGAANESRQPLHSVSFFYNVSPILVREKLNTKINDDIPLSGPVMQQRDLHNLWM